VDHRLEHLRRCDHRATCLARARDHVLLDQRHLRDADLDAQIAARDHHRVRCVDDRVEIGDCVGLLDLRDDPHRGAGEVDEPPQLQDIVSAAHEGERDVVDIVRERELEVDPILCGQRRDRERRRWKVDALCRGDDPPGLDTAENAHAIGGLDACADAAVVDQDLLPRLDDRGEAGERHPDLARAR